MNTINKIQLAASLYDTRDTMKRFWGDRFMEKSEKYRQAILRQDNGSGKLLEAMLTVAKRLQEKLPDNPMAVAMTVAAGVEMIEPS